MSEQADAIEDLTRGNVLDGIRWAARTSAARVMSDYDPETGYDQGWLGYSFHKLLKDRLDRVFSCGKFYVTSPEGSVEGLDVLGAGLRQEDLASMPIVRPGVVERDDLNGSPGWRANSWRWLLASARYGETKQISWPDKSPTKQRVAAQPAPGQLAFDSEQLGLPEVVDVVAHLFQLDPLPTTTLILAHALEPDSGDLELPLGRPRLQFHDDCWYWSTDLMDGWEPGGGTGHVGGPDVPTGPQPSDVPDAPVRLRRRSGRADGARGDQ